MAKAKKFTRYLRKTIRQPEEMVELDLTMGEAASVATVLAMTVNHPYPKAEVKSPNREVGRVLDALKTVGIDWYLSSAYRLASRDRMGNVDFEPYSTPSYPSR